MTRRPSPRALATLLGLRRSIVGMLVMVVLVGMGERLAERFLPLYLVALGGGALSVGLLNALDNLLSALYAALGGRLADRFGIKRSLLVFDLLAMAGFAVVVLVPRWPAVIAGAVLFLSWSAISLPAIMALVARDLPATKQVTGVSLHSLVRRIPMALGPLVGGLCVDLYGVEAGVRLAFAGALGMAAVAAVLQQLLIADDPPREAAAAPLAGGAGPLRRLAAMAPELRRLLAADILIRFCEQIPYAFVVLWCMQRVAEPVSAVQFGLLTAIEMVTALVVYLPVAWFADRGRKQPFVVATFGFFTLFPLVLLFCQSFWPLAAAFVLRGLKEFGEPARKALILELAPADSKAGTFGTYYLVRDLFVAVAAFGGAFLWNVSPAANFLTAFACGLAGTLWYAGQAGRR